METKTVAEIRKQYPFPWGYQQFGNGLFRVIDGKGVEVPIPSMVNLLAMVTGAMNAQAQSDG